MDPKEYKEDQLSNPKFKLPPIGSRKKNFFGSSPDLLLLGSFNPMAKEKIDSYIVNFHSVIIIWMKNEPLRGGTCDFISNRLIRSRTRNSLRVSNSKPAKKDNVDEAPPMASKKSNTNAVTVDSILKNSLEKHLSIMTSDEAKHAVFDPVTYKTLFLAYLTENNLPFAHSHSPALATLLAYVKNSELDGFPIINRHSMRAALNIVYRDLMNDIKDKFAKHKGKFALFLDEWKSGKNFDFLAVTLHYHDSYFKMRKYAIGFEVLNKEVSYTGEVLYKNLDNVLTDYNIKDRIISITIDNASPINSLVTKLKAS